MRVLSLVLAVVAMLSFVPPASAQQGPFCGTITTTLTSVNGKLQVKVDAKPFDYNMRPVAETVITWENDTIDTQGEAAMSMPLVMRNQSPPLPPTDPPNISSNSIIIDTGTGTVTAQVGVRWNVLNPNNNLEETCLAPVVTLVRAVVPLVTPCPTSTTYPGRCAGTGSPRGTPNPTPATQNSYPSSATYNAFVDQHE